ncbi:MAG TPA: 50S ribosomal protein L5 [Chloroflexi bacterium]|nr:MAG: 50S ribosomal protein L5 [Chloroflexota bacterium]HDD55757.1 50S ribosomal protein L5 [Chloroflexota bacterium]
MNSLQERYQREIVPSLVKELNLENVMQCPALTKVVVNIGVGDALDNGKLLDEAVRDLTKITGQKPLINKSKRNIANFKLRIGSAIGTSVTLRGYKMWSFLDRLMNVALPRVRDFRGISPNSFDGRGNYTLGITEQLVFPEVNYDEVSKIRGLEVTIVTTAQDDESGRALLRMLGMPFKEEIANG